MLALIRCNLSLNMKNTCNFGAGWFIIIMSRSACLSGHEVVGADNLNDYYDKISNRPVLIRYYRIRNFSF